MRLKGKVALITGAGRGLGRASALLFAREGARVAVCDISADGDGIAAALAAEGSAGYYQQANVSDCAQVESLVGEISRRVGPIDILVNNAGITRDATLLKMTEEQWQQVLAVNLSGVFYCTRAIAPGMVERGSGKIINIASVVGLYGNFGQTNYAATKAGVIGMTKTWAHELGPKGINVNAVAPGFIGTEMVRAMPEKVLENIRERTPLRRLGEPHDVAHACLFLASAEANFVNGAVLSVDGGLTL